MNSFLTKKEIVEIGFKKVGNDVKISRNAKFYNAREISIGENVRIDDFCIFSGKINLENYIHVAAYSALYGGDAGIDIRNYANISSRVSIYAKSDDYSGETMTNPTIPENLKKVEEKVVIIGEHVIIGTGSVILPGSILNEGCAIGAMSLVKGEISNWSINAGIPVKFLKDRKKHILELEREFKKGVQND